MVDLFLGDSEFGQNLLVEDALVMLRPFAGFRERFFLFGRDRLVVRGVGDSAGDGIEHDLNQADNSGHLTRSHVVDQFVCALPGISGWMSHL